MTTCIAAKAKNGDAIILCADQLATNPIMGHKIDDTQKILPLTSKIYALIAGDDNFGREVYKRVLKAPPTGNGSVEEWAKKVAEEFKNVRFDTVEPIFLGTRGYDRNTIQSANVEIIKQVANELQNFVLPVAASTVIMVAGIDDGDNHAHIFTIENPGMFIGEARTYQTTGAGSVHASNSMYFRDYKIELPVTQAAYCVYEAKKISENAQGVGDKTSMLIVTNDKAEQVSVADLNKFQKVYIDVQNGNKATIKKAMKDIDVAPTEPIKDAPPE